MMNKPLTFILIGLCLVTLTKSGVVAFENNIFATFAADNEEVVKKEEDDLENIRPQIDIKQRLLQHDTDSVKEYNAFAFKEAEPSRVGSVENICITGEMLKAAKERLLYLEKREEKIAEQARLIEISDRRVREQVAKLKIIKDQIVEQAKLADSKIAKESKRLISIYEKMKPKAAAGIFNKMAPNVAAELLRNMKEDQSSSILSKMSPKAAYDVTLSLAKGIKDTERDYDKLQ